MKEPLPPAYVTTPVTVAYAEADDALIVTMTRILGLCWATGYERTPALTPEQLSEFTGRSRSTLYRHLNLLGEMGWIRVDQAGRRTIIRSLIAGNAGMVEGEAAGARVPGGSPENDPAPDRALVQALADLGVHEPKRGQLARLEIDPLWVQAWQLWAKHPNRRSLTNPVGNIILKLQNGERPPREFLRAAEQTIRIRQASQGPVPADEGEDLEAQDDPEPEEEDLLEARRLWTRSLQEIELQMTRSVFDTWLRGCRVVEAGDGRLTIAVRHAAAADWLQHRHLPLIERTLARHAGGEVQVTFVTPVQAASMRRS